MWALETYEVGSFSEAGFDHAQPKGGPNES